MSGQLIWHVFRLPLGFFAQRYVGDVASRVYAGTRIASLMSESLSSSLVSLVMVGLYLLVMFFTSWPLALLSLCLASANVIVVALVQDKRRDMNMHMMNQSAKAMGAAVGGLQAIETLKASGTEGDFFAKWAGYHTKTINAQQELGLYSFLLDAMPELRPGIINALVLILGASLIIKGHLTMGGLIAFQILLNLFLTPIQTMVGFSAQVQEIQGDLARIEDVFKYELDSAWVADKRQGGTPPAP